MASEPTPSFGDLLRRQRKAAGLTQAELAERAGLSVRGIADLECGARRTPRRDTAVLLADALGLGDDERAAFLSAARRTAALPAPATASSPSPGTDATTGSLPRAVTDIRSPHNLPLQPTPLLGREREVERLTALLRRDDVHLVTLTGPAGTGKTRLGMEVASALAEGDGGAFTDGVWLVRLSRLTDPALVLPTIAQTLGLREAGGAPIEEVLRAHVRGRRLLLLLDNFEHIAQAARDVAELLETAPGLTVLATSRAALRLRGEQVVAVPPLGLPPADAPHPLPAHELARYPAVALFLQRARDALPEFAITGATAYAVAAVCRRLDGLPLAIELAAARVTLLPPPALLRRLEHGLPLLTGGARDLDERQRTMRATLAWSYDLLSPGEQRLFRRLAVFVGGCTLEAAEAVCVAPEGAEPLGTDLLEGLSALVDQSLVQQREEGGESRFTMLHVIREFALEQLEASEEANALRRAHAAQYVDLAEREWAADNAAADNVAPKDTDETAAHVERLAPEQDNLRAALAWLRACAEAGARTGGPGWATAGRAATGRGVEAPLVQGLRLAGALLWPWALRGHLGEGRAWLEAFLALDAPSLGAADDQSDRGGGASPAARRGGGRTAAGAARSDSEAFVRARALYALGVLAYWQGDSAAAVPALEQSLAVVQALGDRPVPGVALARPGVAMQYQAANNLGMALKDQGDWGRAQACYEQSLALGRALGRRALIGMPLGNLAVLALAAGDLERAAACSEEALAICRQDHYHTGAAVCLVVQALIARRRGELRRAAALAAEALALHRAAGDERHYGDGLEVCAIVGAAQGQGERAARLLGAAAASRERIGMRRPMEVPTAEDIEAAVAPARAALGEAAWEAALAAGRALSLEEAVAEALAGDDAEQRETSNIHDEAIGGEPPSAVSAATRL